MQLLMLGLSFETAPLELRARASFLQCELPSDLAALLDSPHLQQAAILSTCNRTEIYVLTMAPMEAREALAAFMLERKHLARNEVAEHFVFRQQDEAVQHLFRVAAGLESQVLGEGQILSQVKQAHQAANACRASRSELDALFRHALMVGKRVRTETPISRGAVSIASAAVELAQAQLEFSSCRALVLGTGQVGELAVRLLMSAGAKQVLISNRSLDNAASLAQQTGAEVVAFHDLTSALQSIDLLLCCTGAPHFVLEAADLARIAPARQGNPLLLIDLALPQNLDPAIGALPGMRVCDLDDLQEITARHRRERAALVPIVESIVAAETLSFLQWLRAQELKPAITRIREQVQQGCTRELARFWQYQSGNFTEAQRQLVSDQFERLIDKFLYQSVGYLNKLGDAQAQSLLDSLQGMLERSRSRPLQFSARSPTGVDASSRE